MLTVEELIDEDVLDTLRGMSRAAGYTADYDVQQIDPVNGNPEADNLAVVDTFADPEPVPDRPQNQDRYRKSYKIVVTVIDSAANYADLSARVRRAKADVVKALTYGRSSFTRGGQALGTYPLKGDAAPEIGSGRAKIAVAVEVLFATAQSDPFTNAYSGG